MTPMPPVDAVIEAYRGNVEDNTNPMPMRTVCTGDEVRIYAIGMDTGVRIATAVRTILWSHVNEHGKPTWVTLAMDTYVTRGAGARPSDYHGELRDRFEAGDPHVTEGIQVLGVHMSQKFVSGSQDYRRNKAGRVVEWGEVKDETNNGRYGAGGDVVDVLRAFLAPTPFMAPY